MQTVTEVAKEIGCSVRTVRRALTRLGYDREYGLWLLTPRMVKRVRREVHAGPGRPSKEKR